VSLSAVDGIESSRKLKTANIWLKIVIRMNGTAYSNFDNQEHVLKLGETFEKQPKSAFHTVRCKWYILHYSVLYVDTETMRCFQTKRTGI